MFILMKYKTKKLLKHNLSLILDDLGWSTTYMGKKSGVGQRTVSDIVRIKPGDGESIDTIYDFNTTIEKLELIARACKKEPWQLIAPALGSDIVNLSSDAVEVALNYSRLSKEDQAYIKGRIEGMLESAPKGPDKIPPLEDDTLSKNTG